MPDTYCFPLRRTSTIDFRLAINDKKAKKMCVGTVVIFFLSAFNYFPDNHSVSTKKGFIKLIPGDDRNARILRQNYSLRERISSTFSMVKLGNSQ